MKKLVVLISCILLSGCGLHNANDEVSIVEEKEEIVIIPLQKEEPEVLETVAKNEKRSLSIKHDVKNKDVYIECYIPNFHFSKENVGKKNKDGEGHIHLYLNGKKMGKIYKAAFIVKGLPSGKQTIKIEIAHNNHTPYDGLVEEFEVEIP